MENGTHRTIDPIDLEVVKASLSGIVQEMQNSLFRTGFSTIVRESQDASCALMNASGEVVAQHVVLPLHIGAFPACTAAVIEEFADDIAEGDAFLINHPYHGGSPHAPDIAVITPIFVARRRCSASAARSRTRATSAGRCRAAAPARRARSSTRACTCPPCATSAAYRPNGDIERIIAANSRTPELVLGDIRGQLGADRLGERRLDELVGKFGRGKIARLLRPPARRCRRRRQVRAVVAEWPDGRYEAERFVDDDGIDLNSRCASMSWSRRQGDALAFRFQRLGRPDQGPGQHPPAAGAGRLRLLPDLDDRPAHVREQRAVARASPSTAREGSVLNPRFPAPVNTYNPTIHALVDAIFEAMSHIVPGKARADGSGSRSIILGGRSTYTGKGYVQYEIIGGGAGARASKDGMSGIDRQPEQRQDRAGRDHRERVSDPRHCASS